MGFAFQAVGTGLFGQMPEQVVGQRLSIAAHAATEGVGAFLADHAVRVLSVWQEQKAHVAAIFQYRQGGVQGAPGCLAAGAVAVEAEHHAVNQAKQPLEVVLAGRCAEGGDGVGNAVLGQGNNVHIAFDHQNVFELAILLLGFKQAIQFLALVKYRGLG